MQKIAWWVLSAGLLAGCGGGGAGDAPPRDVPEGLWIGTTSTNRTVTGLVLDDGTYYMFYSAAGNPTLVAGVVQGTGSAVAGSFSSSNAADFNLEGSGVLPASLLANFVLRQSLNGSINYGLPGIVTFTTAFNTAYDVAPSLTTLAGNYTGQVASPAGIENASLTISTAGSFSGTGSGGCFFSGSAAPRARGNVYNITLSFGTTPCIFAGQAFLGIAYFDAATRTLFAAAPNGARTQGVLFIGTKP